MKRPCRLVLSLVVMVTLAGVTSCAGLLPVSSPPRAPAAKPAAPVAARASADEELRGLVELVNRYRRTHGLGELEWDPRLARVAQAHSEDMARRSFFSHRNPDGLTPFDRLRAADVHYQAAAENIAEGQETAEEVFGGWIGSPGHRRNLENPAFTRHGIGLVQRRWTHILIRSR